MSLVDQIIGKTAESTSTGSVATFGGDVVPGLVGSSYRTKYLKPDPSKKKKKVQDGIIPDDARDLGTPEEEDKRNSGEALPIQAMKTNKGQGQSNKEEEDDQGDSSLLPMDLAIVAPTATPSWNKRLPMASSSAPASDTPQVSDTAAPPEFNVMRLVGKKSPSSAEPASMAHVLKADQDDTAEIPGGIGESLLRSGAPMPDPTPSSASAAATALKKFRF